MGLRNLLYIVAVAMSFAAAPALAQEPVLGGEAEAAPAPTAQWSGRCVSDARQSGADCTMIVRAFVGNNRQVVGTASLRFPPDGAAPSLQVSVPLGIYLGAGIGFNIDGATPQQLELQTCDRNGCYGSAAVSPEMLSAMQSGQKLNILFQSMSKQQVTLEMSLVGFTAVYEKLK
ncbi:MAG TPA: invasion associated locus B family protein [Devosia sp.]|jgi:invasion protein IalB|uniref:invasion associated locus B family protein n=1 Tax=Devosia sp. TaxID=1871048 RepID=UPI002DDCA147|nr:invasion associated locus B family protein [Devosia sp.]HEV2517679.1 invasion associated locus B family protein [Devosia sp.]